MEFRRRWSGVESDQGVRFQFPLFPHSRVFQLSELRTSVFKMQVHKSRAMRFGMKK